MPSGTPSGVAGAPPYPLRFLCCSVLVVVLFDEPLIGRESFGMERSCFDGGAHGASGLVGVRAVTELALCCSSNDVGECCFDACIGFPKAHAAHARHVNDEPSAPNGDNGTIDGSVTPFPIRFPHRRGRLDLGTGKQVHKAGLSYTRAANEHSDRFGGNMRAEEFDGGGNGFGHHLHCTGFTNNATREIFVLCRLIVASQVRFGQRNHHTGPRLVRKHQFALEATHVQLCERMGDNDSVEIRCKHLRLRPLCGIAAQEFIGAGEYFGNLRNVGVVRDVDRYLVADNGTDLFSFHKGCRMLAAHHAAVIKTHERESAVKLDHDPSFAR